MVDQSSAKTVSNTIFHHADNVVALSWEPVMKT